MGRDCRLDDPELFTTKKHLMLKGQNPLSLINALSAKWKTGGRLIDLNNCTEAKKGGQSIFNVKIGVPRTQLIGEATETSKQKAKMVAAQMFLKAFFPKGFTWNMTFKALMEKGSPELTRIMEERDALIE